jgi:hypothetical protein
VDQNQPSPMSFGSNKPGPFSPFAWGQKKKAGLKVINRFGHFHYQTKHLACYKAFIICYLCNPHWHKANRENLSFEIQIPLLKSKTQYFPSISHSLFICFLYSQICRFLHFSLSFHKPATRNFEEAEHTTAVKVSTSDPFSFLDSKFIFIFNLWWCSFLLCSHRFFFCMCKQRLLFMNLGKKVSLSSLKSLIFFITLNT